MKERREYIRVKGPLAVAHRVQGTILGATAPVADISAGGVSFPTFQKLDPGMVLNIDITLPGFKKAIATSGQVVWQAESKNINSRFLVGTKFVRLDESDRGRLAYYVSAVAKSEAGHRQFSHAGHV